jgi:hypothetical protein
MLQVWKTPGVIMVPKPGKPLNKVTSHRPISLLAVLSNYLKNYYKKAKNNN